jgi:transcriptional regulator with XRE-family HTH domain
MLHDIPGTRSVFGRTISAEIRARMAARRISGKQLAALAGMSQNYLATRLRDEKPFTLDDVETLMDHLAENEEPAEFMARASSNHGEEVWIAMDGLERSGKSAQSGE